MTGKESESLDILGVKPIGEAVNTVVKGGVEGTAAFLSRICLPAAEEFGLLLRDRVTHWRAANLARMADKAQRKLGPGAESAHAHPRLVSLTVERSSWVDADEVQEMWAGLLASSCTSDGKDESNLIFINLLTQLTTSQARLLCYGCEHVPKRLTASGGMVFEGVYVSMAMLVNISGTQDHNRLDRELDHLRALGLMSFALYREPIIESPEPLVANLEPTNLGLHMYVRCQGSTKSPGQYFGLENPS